MGERDEHARSIEVDPANGNIAVAGITSWNHPQFAVRPSIPRRASRSGRRLQRSAAIPLRLRLYSFLPTPITRLLVSSRGEAYLPIDNGNNKAVIALACYDADNKALDAVGTGVSIGNVTVNESEEFATFTVTSTDPTVTRVSYTTIDGTATSADADYAPATMAIATFANGEATIEVPITDDSLAEANEVFYVEFSNPVDINNSPVAVPISSPVGVGTIVDDEPALFGHRCRESGRAAGNHRLRIYR